LVKDKELAVNVSAGPEETRGPSLFHLTALVRPGKEVSDVEKAMEGSVERVKTDGVTQEEVDKVVMQDRTDLIRQDQSTLSRAVVIGELAVYYHDPDLINTRIDKYHRVTLADVKRVVQQYLTQNNRTVLITMPKAGAAAARSGQ
jgi:zinc protease